MLLVLHKHDAKKNAGNYQSAVQSLVLLVIVSLSYQEISWWRRGQKGQVVVVVEDKSFDKSDVR